MLALLACGSGGSSTPHPASSSTATTQPSVQLSVASKWTITDTDKVTITGTTVPGALLEVTWPGGHTTSKADAQGVITLGLGGIPEGDTTYNLLVTEYGYTSAQQSVTVSRLVSQGAYKASAASIPYNQLIKDPGSLAGRVVTYTGQVFQYDSNTTTSHLIVSITDGGYGFWSDNIWIDLDPATGQSVFNKTVIRFWGTVVGPYSYTTTSNGSITIPEVQLRYLEVVSQP